MWRLHLRSKEKTSSIVLYIANSKKNKIMLCFFIPSKSNFSYLAFKQPSSVCPPGITLIRKSQFQLVQQGQLVSYNSHPQEALTYLGERQACQQITAV